MTQKFWVILYWSFYSPPLTRLRPISRVSGKTLCAEITSAAAKPAQLRVLRKRNSSGKASSDAGPELAGRAAERRWKARRP